MSIRWRQVVNTCARQKASPGRGTIPTCHAVLAAYEGTGAWQPASELPCALFLISLVQQGVPSFSIADQSALFTIRSSGGFSSSLSRPGSDRLNGGGGAGGPERRRPGYGGVQCSCVLHHFLTRICLQPGLGACVCSAWRSEALTTCWLFCCHCRRLPVSPLLFFWPFLPP